MLRMGPYWELKEIVGLNEEIVVDDEGSCIVMTHYHDTSQKCLLEDCYECNGY